MNQINITIKGENLILRQSFRSLMEFEKMTGKTVFSADASITDSLIMYYCMLKSSNPGFKYSFDDFMLLVDEDPEIMIKYNEFMEILLAGEKVETAVDKKKMETR